MLCSRVLILAALLGLPTAAACASANHYGLTISTKATYNVSFNGGVFTATGDHAVLNANDLENALSAGNVEVTTDNGSGGDEKGDLHVEAAFGWTSTNALTLDAYHTIFVDQQVSDGGAGGLTLTNNDGGKLGTVIFSNGNISFASLASQLVINHKKFVLVNSIAMLRSDIADQPRGRYALASSYDASGDGTYRSSPVSRTFKGIFDGLGNTISNLTISSSKKKIGLFAELNPFAIARDVGLLNTSITINGESMAGALAGFNRGSVDQSYATGTTAQGDTVGGLIGENDSSGSITNSYAEVNLTQFAYVGGGLVGLNLGTISNSNAGGSVSAVDCAGGLVGESFGTVSGSYAMGTVSGGAEGEAGGLAGCNEQGLVTSSYATGNVTAVGYYTGGLVGINDGEISQSFSSGSATTSGVSTSNNNYASGGLTGYSDALISNSYALGAASVTNSKYAMAGGLVGSNAGMIEQSFAAGDAADDGGKFNYVGGLVGWNYGGSVTQSYALGAASGVGGVSYIGGLFGYNLGGAQQCYSTGLVSGPRGRRSDLGGLVGFDGTTNGFLDCYWDTATSGIGKLSQGAGNIKNDPGITGLTTKEFRSGLPKGFDPKIWAEDSKINNGLPYLIANPPPN